MKGWRLTQVGMLTEQHQLTHLASHWEMSALQWIFNLGTLVFIAVSSLISKKVKSPVLY